MRSKDQKAVEELLSKKFTELQNAWDQYLPRYRKNLGNMLGDVSTNLAGWIQTGDDIRRGVQYVAELYVLLGDTVDAMGWDLESLFEVFGGGVKPEEAKEQEEKPRRRATKKSSTKKAKDNGSDGQTEGTSSTDSIGD